MSRIDFTTPNEIAAMFAAMMLQRRGGGGRIEVTSTLRDRTPQPQETPLEEAEVVWGKPSDFSYGSRAKNSETGPTVQTTWTDNPGDDPPDEPTELPPIVYQWREMSRKEKTVRIDGTPDGAYVDEARAKVSTFELPPAPDGRAQIVEITFLDEGTP